MMLDTTFSVLQNYYTSIPTLIIANTGMPIGFTENEKIYNDFFKRFENLFGFKIPSFVHVIESDEGSALLSTIEKQGSKHLCCLRHLIVNLGTTKFSDQVKRLVSAISDKDLETLKETYSNSWRNITDRKEKELLLSTLDKVGLGFFKDRIEIINDERWCEVSMNERSKFKMPSCSNQIESMHGHLNALVPRRNDFFHSLKRLIDFILKKNHTFKERFAKNYQAHKRKIKNILKHLPNDRHSAIPNLAL